MHVAQLVMQNRTSSSRIPYDSVKNLASDIVQLFHKTPTRRPASLDQQSSTSSLASRHKNIEAQTFLKHEASVTSVWQKDRRWRWIADLSAENRDGEWIRVRRTGQITSHARVLRLFDGFVTHGARAHDDYDYDYDCDCDYDCDYDHD